MLKGCLEFEVLLFRHARLDQVRDFLVGNLVE